MSGRSERTATRGYGARLGLSFASVLLVFGLAELALRLLAPVPPAFERNMEYAADPYTGYRLAPNGRGFFGDIPADANRHGHRSPDVTLAKPAARVRILVLGDSFTVGSGVAQEAAYPARLEQILNRGGRRRFEVVNTGVGGWSPFQYAEYYERYGAAFQPDLVLVGFFVGNDTMTRAAAVEDVATVVSGRRVRRLAAADPTLVARIWLEESSHLARLAFGTSVRRFERDRERCDDFPPHLLEIERRRRINHLAESKAVHAMMLNSVRQIARIQRLARRDGVPVHVVLIPDELQINEALAEAVLTDGQSYDLDMPQSLLLRIFERQGIPAIDLLSAFRADPRCLYQNGLHWTSEGHQLAAREIHAALEAVLQEKGRAADEALERRRARLRDGAGPPRQE